MQTRFMCSRPCGGARRLLACATLLIPALLLAGVAAAQEIEDMPSGSPKGWSPSHVVSRYSLPEPVGWIELRLTYNPPDALGAGRHLQAGALMFRDFGALELPSAFLQCLPSPRGEIELRTVFIAPERPGDPWFERFGTSLTIPYGRTQTDVVPQAQVIGEYPNIRFDFLGKEIRRVMYFLSPTDRGVSFDPADFGECERESRQSAVPDPSILLRDVSGFPPGARAADEALQSFPDPRPAPAPQPPLPRRLTVPAD
jgi:hypothetical protein